MIKGMMKRSIMKSIFRHHHMNCLNTHEKVCIAAIIGCTFVRGICIGMYLSDK